MALLMAFCTLDFTYKPMIIHQLYVDRFSQCISQVTKAFLMALHGVSLCIKDDASLLDFMHFELSFDCTKLVSLNLF
jgi:hypothetical protein